MTVLISQGDSPFNKRFFRSYFTSLSERNSTTKDISNLEFYPAYLTETTVLSSKIGKRIILLIDKNNNYLYRDKKNVK